MSYVSLTLEYFPDPTRGVPVFNGFIYVGEPDTDPEIPSNQKTVVLRELDGTEIQTAQPVRTGAGGIAIYNGNPVQLLVEGNYSLKVLDQQGGQVYYIPNAESVGALASVTNMRDEQIATSGQKVFTLGGFITYTPGANNITVYIDGRRQYSGAYTETDTSTVTFSEGLAEGQVVMFSVNEQTSSVIYNASETTANFEDITSDINTLAKFLGRIVANETTGRMVYAAGLNPGDVWKFFDGTTAHTPA